MFRREKFLSVADRDKLSDKINIDTKHLKFWWRNRRQKESRSSALSEKTGPHKRPNVSRSTSAAPTPSPTPSNLSSSCSTDQWQPPISQPIATPLFTEWTPQQDPYLVPYQQAPVPYMTHINHFPYIDPTLFAMNQQMAPHLFAYPQFNGMDMAYNTTNPNVVPVQYYYGQNGMTNGHFPYSNHPSAQFTQPHQQVKLEPMKPIDDDATTDCAATNALLEYLRQMNYEFSDHDLLGQ